WAVVNALTLLTKKMGPGSRHDTLDNHFSYHNFLKLIRFSKSFYYTNFINALPDLTLVAEWTQLVCDWKQDKSKPMPYLSAEEHDVECGGSDTTEADLKAKLKEDECKAKEHGELLLHEISATSCLGLGLLIEDSQYVFLLSFWNILDISIKTALFWQDNR
ncbi:hypothetical protein ARMGADRAFT_936820, partial [Armillaria gallica]